ncbi:MAG TPA: TIR domain-containing protein [Myxococcaceae bacterium]|nr:TIR domain-containing protein [Myxococcaceae bacterium]
MVGSTIFLSYRRMDADGHAGRLYDRLQQAFPGQVFMDVSTLAPGMDYVEALESSVSSCGVLIAMIGREWLNAQDEWGRRRLDSPEDFLCVEIATALQRKVCVIPVLVSGARLPQPEELPEELVPLLRRQAIELSPEGYDDGVQRLIQAIRLALKEAESPQAREKRRRLTTRQVQAQQALAAKDWPVSSTALATTFDMGPRQPGIATERQRLRRQQRLTAFFGRGHPFPEHDPRGKALRYFKELRSFLGGSYRNLERLIRMGARQTPAAFRKHRRMSITGVILLVVLASLQIARPVLERLWSPQVAASTEAPASAGSAATEASSDGSAAPATPEPSTGSTAPEPSTGSAATATPEPSTGSAATATPEPSTGSAAAATPEPSAGSAPGTAAAGQSQAHDSSETSRTPHEQAQDGKTAEGAAWSTTQLFAGTWGLGSIGGPTNLMSLVLRADSTYSLTALGSDGTAVGVWTVEGNAIVLRDDSEPEKSHRLLLSVSEAGKMMVQWKGHEYVLTRL